ncbi:heterokaryon incompatibility protein-domain-containing protein [Hypoxylon sp. NC1633]|nr:heterokaryon incompatibility protein-domain-containing protein [Hypoxylon sp. NC1633]
MWLINTRTRQLKEFLGERPPYAILSHRWEDEEVTFQDIKESVASSRKGYAKLYNFCLQAATDGYEWAWIDTCCIDKSSSTELSEAINSMYSWYADSDVCYAYLSDVEGINEEIIEFGPENIGSPTRPKFNSPWLEASMQTMSASTDPGLVSQFNVEFAQSKWFTRAWTLQELIAPRRVEFYNQYWIELGTKASLKTRVVEITGIDEGVLLGYTPLSKVTVALKMSWAAHRIATREEDMAYCLLGLFQINMPLLYGEGAKSFRRLQEAIIRQYEDYSILVHSGGKMGGFIANSPAEFGGLIQLKSGLMGGPPIKMDLRKLHSLHNTTDSRHRGEELLSDTNHAPMALTNRGLHGTFLCQMPSNANSLAWTKCVYEDNTYGPLLIFMLIYPLQSKDMRHREPGLVYFRKKHVTAAKSEGFEWRILYLHTWQDEMNMNYWQPTITLHCSREAPGSNASPPIAFEAWHSEAFEENQYGMVTKDQELLQLRFNKYTGVGEGAINNPVIVSLVLLERSRDTKYVFVIGLVNYDAWCLALHEVTRRAVDHAYMDMALRTWSSKNINEPDVARRLNDSIKIAVSDTEVISISLKCRGTDMLTIKASLNKRVASGLTKRPSDFSTSSPVLFKRPSDFSTSPPVLPKRPSEYSMLGPFLPETPPKKTKKPKSSAPLWLRIMLCGLV